MSACSTRYSILISILGCIFFSPIVVEAIEFTDVTDEAGLNHYGDSWGIAWGDFNNDGWPDLYDGNHREKPAFFINQKNGTFVNKVDEIFSFNGILDSSDTHGAQWVDLDNDGFSDLVVQVGSNGGGSTNFIEWFNSQILMNQGGQLLVQQAEELGLANPDYRGRTPLVFDYDRDGLLDILFTNMQAIGPRMFRQSSFMVFEETTTETNLISDQNAMYAVITDLDLDNSHELIIGQNPAGVFSFNSLFYSDIADTLGLVGSVGLNTYDVAIGDFDGDLKPDIFKGGWDFGNTVLEQPTSNILSFQYLWSAAPTIKEIGFTFRTSGNVTFEMAGAWVLECNDTGDSDYFFGSTGWHPTCGTSSSAFIEVLSPDDPLNQGLWNYDVDTDPGIVVAGYDPILDLWTLVFIYEDRGTGIEPPTLTGLIRSDNPIALIEQFGPYTERFKVPSKLYLNSPGGFTKAGAEVGIDQLEAGGNYIATADFDNDGDLDIYASNTSQVANVRDVIYENTGGMFIKRDVVVDSLEGVGRSVSVADFDLDGYVDVYVTHGSGNFPHNMGPHQLLKNMGQGNNWLQIDLEGIDSNRDGIGAKVILTAGGTSQLREQNAGMHRYAQNHQRIHFGLGQNEKVDEILVYWPSGIVQTVVNIPANQIIRIIEDDALSTNFQGNPEVINGEFGLYVWKNFFDGPYSIRVHGTDNTIFTINVISDKDLSSIVPVDTQGNDGLTVKSRSFEFRANTPPWGYGVDFEATPGSKSLISFETERGTNPRFLFAGRDRRHIAPSGWVFEKSSLPEFGGYISGETNGIVAGRLNGDATSYELRWSAREFAHSYSLWLASDEPGISVETSLLEVGDEISQTSNAIGIKGKLLAPWEDGITLYGVTGSKLAVSFETDNLFQQHNTNLFQELGFPNAYWLEAPSPDGQPALDEGNSLTFIWREEGTNRWHFKFTAGGSTSNIYYTGSITSTGIISVVDASTLEAADSVTQNSGNALEFDVRVLGNWTDELVIDLEPGENLIFTYPDESLKNTIRIGEENWKVSSSSVALLPDN